MTSKYIHLLDKNCKYYKKTTVFSFLRVLGKGIFAEQWLIPKHCCSFITRCLDSLIVSSCHLTGAIKMYTLTRRDDFAVSAEAQARS